MADQEAFLAQMAMQMAQRQMQMEQMRHYQEMMQKQNAENARKAAEQAAERKQMEAERADDARVGGSTHGAIADAAVSGAEQAQEEIYHSYVPAKVKVRESPSSLVPPGGRRRVRTLRGWWCPLPPPPLVKDSRLFISSWAGYVVSVRRFFTPTSVFSAHG